MTETRWLDDREQRAWRGYVQMHAMVAACIGRSLQTSFGLSEGDFGVLVNLSEAPDGRLRAYQLGQALQWEKSRLSHHITRMEGRGLVRREECPTDARGAFVVITEKGRAAIEAAAPQHVEDVRRFFLDQLTPAQIDALGDMAQTVLARLRADPDDGACG